MEMSGTNEIAEIMDKFEQERQEAAMSMKLYKFEKNRLWIAEDGSWGTCPIIILYGDELTEGQMQALEDGRVEEVFQDVAKINDEQAEKYIQWDLNERGSNYPEDYEEMCLELKYNV